MLNRIVLVEGDITHQRVDAIVNAANSSLLGGGGVDGAIHKAAGQELYEECRKLNGCSTGEAKITKGYRLPAKWVIHTVGPIFKDGTRGEDEKLARCYRNCFELADHYSIETIAFPAISTGAYAFPMGRASRIAVAETVKFLQRNDHLKQVFFVCVGQKSYESYAAAIKELIPPGLTSSEPA